MNYEVAIKKPFTDLGKLAIGIVIGVIPIINWIARGFTLECSGVGKYKYSKGMPEWKDIWYYFVKGLASYIIAFVYALPAIIVFSLTAVYAIGSYVALGGLMPGWNNAIPDQLFRNWVMQNWTQFAPVLAAMAPLVILGAVLLFLGLYAYPIGVLNYLKTKSFGKAFDMKVVKATAMNKKYFLAWVASGVIAIAVNAVGSLIPIIGTSVAFFISGVIAWDLFGQAFAKK
jgi:hypothetical protein